MDYTSTNGAYRCRASGDAVLSIAAEFCETSGVRRGWMAAIVAAAVAGIAGSVVVLASSRGGPGCASFPDAFHAGTSHELCGPVLDRYRVEGGPDGRLGFPTGSERTVTSGPALRLADREVGFRNGTIYLDSRSGRTVVGAWFPYNPLR